jgi:hypothetical protein
MRSMLFGNQHRDRLADGLLLEIAEQPLRALVPGADHAVEVLADDGVVGRFDDRGKAMRHLLGALLLTHVDQHVDGADEGAGGVVQGGGKRHERHAAAVRALGDGLAAAHRAPFFQGDRHGACIVRHRRAVGPEQPP